MKHSGDCTGFVPPSAHWPTPPSKRCCSQAELQRTASNPYKVSAATTLCCSSSVSKCELKLPVTYSHSESDSSQRSDPNQIHGEHIPLSELFMHINLCGTMDGWWSDRDTLPQGGDRDGKPAAGAPPSVHAHAPLFVACCRLTSDSFESLYSPHRAVL